MDKAKQEFKRVVAETVEGILQTSATYREARQAAGEIAWSQDRFEQTVGKEVIRELDERFMDAPIEKAVSGN